MSKFKTTLNRVIVLKMDAKTDDFDKPFMRTFRATRMLYNEVACWGNDTLSCRMVDAKGIPTYSICDMKSQRLELYAKTNKKMDFEKFSKLLRVLYLGLISASQGSHMYTKIFGGGTLVDEMSLEDWSKLDSHLEHEATYETMTSEFLFRVSNTLATLDFMKREPFTFELSSKERIIAVKNVMGMLKSWIEVNHSTSENYEAEKVEIASKFSSVPSNIVPSLRKFMNTCIEKNIIAHFDPRVRAYLKDCVIPALKKQEGITDHFYLGKNDEPISYCLNDEFVALLKELPDLWTSEDPLILDNLYLLEAQMVHEAHRDTSAYAFIGEQDFHRFMYYLGSNYTKYKISALGAPLGDISIPTPNPRKNATEAPLEFINGTSVETLNVSVHRGSSDSSEYSFKVYTKDRYSNGS